MFSMKRYSLFFSIVAIVLAACSTSDDDRDSSKVNELKFFDEFKRVTLVSQKTLAGPSMTVFFWYGCPHCLKFTQSLAPWQSENAQVNIQYIPITWSEKSQLHAKVYFLIKDRADFSTLHVDVYDWVKNFARTDSVLDQKAIFISKLSEKGVPMSDIFAALSNAGFSKQLENAKIDSDSYNVKTVPTILLNQKFKLINAKVDSFEQGLLISEQFFNKH